MARNPKKMAEICEANEPNPKFDNPVHGTVLCADHFTEESFDNLGQYRAGFASRLRLRKDVVPTIPAVPTISMPMVSQYQKYLCFTIMLLCCQLFIDRSRYTNQFQNIILLICIDHFLL